MSEEDRLDGINQEDVEKIFQRLESGNKDIFERLSDSTDQREVYALKEPHVMDGFVIREASGKAKRQNKREARVFAESLERGEIFTPAVAAWSDDYQYMVVEKVNALKKKVNKHRARGMRQEAFEYRRSPFEGVIPDEWVDEDRDTEYGTDGNKILVMDAGMVRPINEWYIEEPEESQYFNKNGSITVVNYEEFPLDC